MKMKNFLTILMLSLVAILPLQAKAAGEASAFIDKLGNQALTVLSTKGVKSADGNAAFRTLLNDNFDVPAIGRFVLGRYWNIATPEQQTEYQSLFKVMVEQIYTERFSAYSGESFKVTGERPDGNDTVVTTQIVHTNGNPATNVDWRIKSTDGSLKITDVIVEGVSMSVTQRSEFASVIQRNGGKMDALLKVLRDKTATGPAVAK